MRMTDYERQTLYRKNRSVITLPTPLWQETMRLARLECRSGTNLVEYILQEYVREHADDHTKVQSEMTA